MNRKTKEEKNEKKKYKKKKGEKQVEKRKTQKLNGKKKKNASIFRDLSCLLRNQLILHINELRQDNSSVLN